MRLLLAAILAAWCSAFGQVTYTIQTIAGGAVPGGVAGLSASLGPVPAVAADASGNLYFTLSDYGVILRMDTAGNLTQITNVGGWEPGLYLGQTPEWFGGNGPAYFANYGITCLTVDAAGNIYFGANNRIFEVSNGTVTAVAGNGNSFRNEIGRAHV